MTTIEYFGNGLFLVVIPAFLLLKQLRDIFKTLASANWPIVEGRLINCQVEQQEYEDRPYNANINYEYDVNGKKYSSDVVFFGFTIGAAWHANFLVEKVKNNKRLNVSYNPKNPGQSVLITGIQTIHLISILIVSLALFFLMIFLGGIAFWKHLFDLAGVR
jgi:hypothetical protein